MKALIRFWLALGSALMPASAMAQTTYIIEGLDYSPYRAARLVITTSDGLIKGELHPLIGDATRPAAVIGKNQTDGVMTLSFSLPSGPLTRTFNKQVTKSRITWQYIDGVNSVTFFRPRSGEFSDFALTL